MARVDHGIVLTPSAILLATHALHVRGHSDAVIMQPIVTAKTSPDEQSLDASVVYEGLNARLSGCVGDWVKIALADGEVGLIRLSQCETI